MSGNQYIYIVRRRGFFYRVVRYENNVGTTLAHHFGDRTKAKVYAIRLNQEAWEHLRKYPDKEIPYERIEAKIPPNEK